MTPWRSTLRQISTWTACSSIPLQPHYQSWLEMAGRRGLQISQAAVQGEPSAARPSRPMAQFWAAGRFSDEGSEGHGPLEKEAAFRRIIAVDFPAMPVRGGACSRRCTRRASAWRSACCARENVAPGNPAAGALGTASMAPTSPAATCSNGKPDPQIFLVAAQRRTCRRRGAS